MEILLSNWTSRPDYEAIWKSIQCPLCGAPRGEACRNRAVPRTLASTMPRPEPHMERVWEAIENHINAIEKEKENAGNEKDDGGVQKGEAT